VIWSRILQLFPRNDHHIETCRMQHLGCYLENQGHFMTLQQNHVCRKTLLFKVWFYNYFWQTTSVCPIPIRGALPSSDPLLFCYLKLLDNRFVIKVTTLTLFWWRTKHIVSLQIKKKIKNNPQIIDISLKEYVWIHKNLCSVYNVYVKPTKS